MKWSEFTKVFEAATTDARARYNVPPGTKPWMMHCLDGKEHIDAVPWGYRPEWAKEKKIPMAVNATIEKARSPYWRGLWKAGRTIVPADGWYEWTGEKGNKQPWFIRLQSDEPMYLAAVSNFTPGMIDPPAGVGFAILTSEAIGGLLDVHDRRPVVLSPEDAQIWLDRDFSADQAEELARSTALQPEAFTWYQVSKEVNRAGHDGPQLIEPLEVD